MQKPAKHLKPAQSQHCRHQGVTDHNNDKPNISHPGRRFSLTKTVNSSTPSICLALGMGPAGSNAIARGSDLCPVRICIIKWYACQLWEWSPLDTSRKKEAHTKKFCFPRCVGRRQSLQLMILHSQLPVRSAGYNFHFPFTGR